MRIYRQLRLPLHVRWELYPVKHEEGAKAEYGGSYMEEVNWWEKRKKNSLANEIKYMAPEILLLRGLRTENPRLWDLSFPFHFGLYLSQEMGIAPKEIHDKGTVQHLKVGSTTGMNPAAVKDSIEFIQEEMEEITGYKVEIPWDREGAEVLLLHNAGEVLAWPENVGAFAVIFQAAGISWTLSSEELGYEVVNCGLWYDDVQMARVAVKHAEIVKSGRLNLDPSRNDFPVTLHDPCNIVRAMGIVEPQRRILRRIAPKFREMTPHGVDNYCCGGGSGFAIMSGHNFAEWRTLMPWPA